MSQSNRIALTIALTAIIVGVLTFMGATNYYKKLALRTMSATQTPPAPELKEQPPLANQPVAKAPAPKETTCPKVEIDRANNIILLDGKALNTTEQVNPLAKIVDVKVSDGCKYFAFLTYTKKIQTDTFGTAINVYILPRNGERIFSVYETEVMGDPKSLGEQIEMSAFSDSHLVLVKGGGDNSPGPGYYALGVEPVTVVTTKDMSANRYGNLLSLSPDGRWLAYSAVDGVYLRDLVTGTQKTLATRTAGPAIYSYVFSPDSKAFAYAEIPGMKYEYSLEYTGPSRIVIRTLEDRKISAPQVIYTNKVGEPFYLTEWTQPGFPTISRTTSTGKDESYWLDIRNGELQEFPRDNLSE